MGVAVDQAVVFNGTAVAGTSLTTGTLAGTPAVGSLCVIAIDIADNATTITTPTGYTLLGPGGVGAILRAGSSSLAIYTKVAGAAEPTSVPLAWGSSANAECSYMSFSGQGATPIEAALTASASGTSLAASVTGAAATTDGTECLCCIVGTLGKPTHSAPLDSASLDGQGASTGGSGTTGSSLAVMHKIISANETPTMGDTLSVSRNWGAIVFAIQAASGGGGSATGSLPTVTVSTPTGSATGGAAVTAAIPTISVTAPSGSAVGGAQATGSLPTIATSTPTGSATGGATATGSLPTVLIIAPIAQESGGASTSGPLATVTIVPPAGSAAQVGNAAASGSLPTVLVLAPLATQTRVPLVGRLTVNPRLGGRVTVLDLTGDETTRAGLRGKLSE